MKGMKGGVRDVGGDESLIEGIEGIERTDRIVREALARLITLHSINIFNEIGKYNYI